MFLAAVVVLLACARPGPAQPCVKSLAKLEIALDEVLGHGFNLVINCAAYREDGVLETAIVSTFALNSTSSTDARYKFVCSQDSILTGLPLEGNLSTVEPGAACLVCDEDSAANPCPTPCAAKCERCYGTADDCTLCKARVGPCLSEDCRASCQDGYEVDHDNSNLCIECECGFGRVNTTHSVGGECGCICPTFNDARCRSCSSPTTGVIELKLYPKALEAETKLAMLEEGEGKHPPEPALGEGTCQRFCLDGKEPYRFANETMVCFACGMEYCVECEDNACTKCLLDTALFKHECFTGAQADQVTITIIHERDEAMKEEARLLTNLAISLPIVCTAIILAVIVLFVFMAVCAYYRYSHISRKRASVNPVLTL